MVMTSWKSPTGEPLVIAVNKYEAMFHNTIKTLLQLELITYADYMTSEALIMRDGFWRVA